MRFLDLEGSTDSMIDLRLGLLALQQYAYLHGVNRMFQEQIKGDIQGRYDVEIEDLVQVDAGYRETQDISPEEYSYCVESELLFREKLKHQWRVLLGFNLL